jgi:hypothetical protein
MDCDALLKMRRSDARCKPESLRPWSDAPVAWKSDETARSKPQILLEFCLLNG